MLPSQGLFRSIPCPFFLAGLCERPHCSFRHCRSDVRIDRKLETEALDEATPSSEGGTTSSTSNTNQVIASGVVKDAGSSVKVPENSESLSCNNNKSDPGTTEELQTTRLKTTSGSEESISVETNRKRHRDSDSEDSSKRRRLSSDTTSSMGQFYTKFINKNENEGSRKERIRKERNEIEKLAREIEDTGSSSSKQNKHKKHKKERKSSGADSSKSRTSTNHHHKKETDKLVKEESRRREEERRKDSREKRERDDSKKRKEKESSSSTSSPKDAKRIRKTSEASPESEESSKKAHKDKVPPSPQLKDKESKKDESRSPSTSPTKGALMSVENNVDTGNRFTGLTIDAADVEAMDDTEMLDDNDSLDFTFLGGSDSDDDPERVARECRELFENYKPEKEVKQQRPSKPEKTSSVEKKEEENEEDGFNLVARKRVAHAGATPKSSPPVVPKRPPATSKNLQDTMYKRLEEQSKKSTNSHNGRPGGSSPTSKPQSSGKMRIAHVPNADKLAKKPTISTFSQKPSLSPIATSKPFQPGSLTYSQTAAKGTKREAHQPTAATPTIKGPIIYRDAPNKTTKIPHVTRQQMMDKLFAEFSKVLGDPQEAFETTTLRENELVNKCSSKQVYISSGISIISGMRRGSHQEESGKSNGPNRVISHAEMLSGSLAAKNCSVRMIKREDSLPQGNRLYRALKKYTLTERELEENGYPRPHPSGEKGRVIARARQGEQNNNTINRRICDRCKTRYDTTDDGEPLMLEVCNYHWGRKYNVKAKGGRGARETTYSCCGGEDDKLGCVTAVCHVSRCPIPISDQKGFVDSIKDEGDEEEMGKSEWDVIAIDCEMVYTTHGSELARVTVVGTSGQILMDEVVKPLHKVLDCNTRFSGITFDDMDKATRNIIEVQAIILMSLRPNTILIGHSLESDLLALHLRHDCVIDTSVLYPHRLGPPKKRALKNLSAEILKKVIQEMETGHDSAEDAQMAMELVLAKLKADCGNK